MYRPPYNAPVGELALSTDEVVEALAGLMAHRLRQGSRLPVAPLDRIPQTLSRYRQGLSTRTRDRRSFGETRFVVHPDGTLTYETGMGSNVRRLGNLFEQTMAEILRSESYQASLEDSDAKRARHCSHCRYQDACNGRPLLEFQDVAPPGPCPVEARLCEFAETSLFSKQRSGLARLEPVANLHC
jgi:radical SAM protein with 4Fe4S-binding SPASM domain